MAELLKRDGSRDEAVRGLSVVQREVSTYLADVRSHLHLDPRVERRVISELSTHFDDKVGDLELQGVPRDEAVKCALASFGEARSIARLLYEAHSRGSWTEALIGCQPHLIVAALFATHVWRHPVLLGAAFGVIAIIALLAWRNGSASWMYPWLGYAVVPLLLVTYLSFDPLARTVYFFFSGHGVPAPFWHLGLSAVLNLIVLWILATTSVAVARRDWLLLSLMLLPLPVLVLWVITVSQYGGVLTDALRNLEARFSTWDTAMGWFFAALGVTTALFVRLRQRALKVAAVIAVGIVGGAAAARSLWGDLGFFRMLAIALCLCLFLTVPLLLRAMVNRPDQAEDEMLPS